jgi:hypothetical protein
MAIAGPAHCADDGCQLTKTRSRLNRALSLAPKLLATRLLTISIVACAMALAGCARNPAQRELRAVQREARTAPVCLPARPRVRTVVQHVYTPAPRQAEPRVSRPDPALLEPQTAPDCEFRRADIKSVDPNEWARLRAEYERQCYRDAENAARNRLGQLQDAVR